MKIVKDSGLEIAEKVLVAFNLLFEGLGVTVFVFPLVKYIAGQDHKGLQLVITEDKSNNTDFFLLYDYAGDIGIESGKVSSRKYNVTEFFTKQDVIEAAKYIGKRLEDLKSGIE